MVCTADDADAAVFPLNTPVLVDSVDYLTSAGTTGTLYLALDGIFDQAAPLVVVVRVAEEALEADQNSAIIGSGAGGSFTGLHALKQAEAALNVRPRILGVPGGLDTQPVAAELISIANSLRGFAYISAHGATTKEEAVTYRGNFGDDRAMVLWPGLKVWNTLDDAEAVESPVARALGLRAKLDHEQGWHKTLSNEPIQGVIGTEYDVHFDLRSPDTTAGYLNASEVTALIRKDGFRFWGSRTCSADPLMAFESAVRTRDILGDTVADSHMWAIDKPMSKVLIQDLLEGINAKLREMKLNGWIVDGVAFLPDGKNTQTTLQDGKLYIDFDYSPVPPLENLLLTQRLNNSYLVQLVSA